VWQVVGRPSGDMPTGSIQSDLVAVRVTKLGTETKRREIIDEDGRRSGIPIVKWTKTKTTAVSWVGRIKRLTSVRPEVMAMPKAQ
jgi:hypothetical protein